MDYTALASEISTDPESLGYAAFVTAGNDQDIANLLNQRPETFSPPVTWTSSQPYVPLSSVLLWAGTGPYQSLVAGSTNDDASIAAACGAALATFRLPSIESFLVTGTDQQSLLNALVTATVLTQDQVDALVNLQNVPASRAEVLFGIGTVVSNVDVAISLRGN